MEAGDKKIEYSGESVKASLHEQAREEVDGDDDDDDGASSGGCGSQVVKLNI